MTIKNYERTLKVQAIQFTDNNKEKIKKILDRLCINYIECQDEDGIYYEIFPNNTDLHYGLEVSNYLVLDILGQPAVYYKEAFEKLFKEV